MIIAQLEQNDREAIFAPSSLFSFKITQIISQDFYEEEMR